MTIRVNEKNCENYKLTYENVCHAFLHNAFEIFDMLYVNRLE